VNGWCGVLVNKLIGPYVFDNSSNMRCLLRHRDKIPRRFSLNTLKKESEKVVEADVRTCAC